MKLETLITQITAVKKQLCNANALLRDAENLREPSIIANMDGYIQIAENRKNELMTELQKLMDAQSIAERMIAGLLNPTPDQR
ncbi:hypothetical protein [Salmonella enterica]|uniref:hypothetical protein n=1 Tax=Salmonella enterica TaxID=28901 RepID=UPI0015FEC406|nr:hypothetical protein [Salmonella enterica]